MGSGTPDRSEETKDSPGEAPRGKDIVRDGIEPQRDRSTRQILNKLMDESFSASVLGRTNSWPAISAKQSCSGVPSKRKKEVQNTRKVSLGGFKLFYAANPERLRMYEVTTFNLADFYEIAIKEFDEIDFVSLDFILLFSCYACFYVWNPYAHF